jgi:hypothetical protein
MQKGRIRGPSCFKICLVILLGHLVAQTADGFMNNPQIVGG